MTHEELDRLCSSLCGAFGKYYIYVNDPEHEFFNDPEFGPGVGEVRVRSYANRGDSIIGRILVTREQLAEYTEERMRHEIDRICVEAVLQGI